MAPTIIRSMLSLPGNRARFLEKARTIPADAICFDLEDSVTPDDKAAARDLVAAALPRFDAQGRLLVVRINGLDTGLAEHDLEAVVGPNLHAINLPKCHSPDILRQVDAYLTFLERSRDLPAGHTKLIPWVESAQAIAQAYEICTASPRLLAVCLGAEDYALSLGLPRTSAGAEIQFPRALLANAAAAAGLLSIDTPLLNYNRRRRLPARRLPGPRPRLPRQVLHPPQPDRARQPPLRPQRRRARLGAPRPGRLRRGQAQRPRRRRPRRRHDRRPHRRSRPRHSHLAGAGRSPQRSPRSAGMSALSDVREILAGDGEVGVDIVRNVRRWVDDKVIPVADEFEHADRFPDELHRDMKAMGLFAIPFPERYGGLGLSYETYAAVMEEIARGWMGLAGIINGNTVGGVALERDGTDEQRQRFLPGLASGELQAAFCLTEPNAGSDAQAIRTTAVRDGDDYRLNGNKLFVTNGDRAGLYLTMTKTDPQARPRHRGISAFLVERDTPGLSVGKLIEKTWLQGARHHRDLPGRRPRARPQPARRPRRAGLQADAPRPGGGPRQRRRPRRRRRPGRLRRRHQLRPNDARPSASPSPSTRPSR